MVLPGEVDGATLLARVALTTGLRPGDRTELLLDARRAHLVDTAGSALAHPPSRDSA